MVNFIFSNKHRVSIKRFLPIQECNSSNGAFKKYCYILLEAKPKWLNKYKKKENKNNKRTMKTLSTH